MFRITDPDTSKQAAIEMMGNGKLGDRQRQVLWLVRKFPGRTHGEYAHMMYDLWSALGIICCAETPHKRLPELEAKGLVYSLGSRRCTETGKEARLWFAEKSHPQGKLL